MALIRYVLKEEDFERLCNHPEDIRDKAFLAILFNTGCRSGELVVIKLSDVDLENKTVRIIDSKKKEMTRVEYMVEVQGLIPPKNLRAFFPLKQIRDCGIEGLMPLGGIREAGLDFGESVGKNVLTISEKNKSRRRVLYQKHYRKPIEECLDEILETCTKYDVKIIKADSKPVECQKVAGNKLGSIPVKYIDARFHKNNMMGQLQLHIRKGSIEWDKDKHIKLIVELRKYRKGKRSGDDRVDSLALSVYEVPYKTKPEGRVFIHRTK